MISRPSELNALERLLRQFPVVGILGARQVGKTTLAKMYGRSQSLPVTYFDLEDPVDLARLEDPMLGLGELRGLVVLDEIQRKPDLFPVLRVLADRMGKKTRYLILGSASPDLIPRAAESLAGRVAYRELQGFSLEEIGTRDAERLWLRGGLPQSYLARTIGASFDWRRAYIRTFLEWDLPQLGVGIPSATTRRFWSMLAHYHGQTWNASEFSRSFGVADTTVRSYLDILTAAFVVWQLQPWHENIGKRQVKAPKVYITDSGILHALLNLHSAGDVEGHPKLGASWEGFVINQVVRTTGARPEECFFWATHAGAELDLLIVRGRKRIGFEIKRTSSPTLTPSMRHALVDLKLSRLTVVHAGDKRFALARNVEAIPLARLLHDVPKLHGT